MLTGLRGVRKELAESTIRLCAPGRGIIAAEEVISLIYPFYILS